MKCRLKTRLGNIGSIRLETDRRPLPVLTAIVLGSVRYTDEILHPKRFADAKARDLVADAVTYQKRRNALITKHVR